jgi:transcriptional regulator with XRE-family HTH domain
MILARMTQEERIIRKFGTQERLAGALGCRQSTIAGWKRRGFVPVRQQTKVLKAAHALGLALRPRDFFDGNKTETKSRTGAAA